MHQHRRRRYTWGAICSRRVHDVRDPLLAHKYQSLAYRALFIVVAVDVFSQQVPYVLNMFINTPVCATHPSAPKLQLHHSSCACCSADVSKSTPIDIIVHAQYTLLNACRHLNMLVGMGLYGRERKCHRGSSSSTGKPLFEFSSVFEGTSYNWPVSTNQSRIQCSGKDKKGISNVS